MKRSVSMFLAASLLYSFAAAAHDDGRDDARGRHHPRRGHSTISLGPRPFYLVEGMSPGPLQRKLLACENGPFSKTDFSIGHRGAGLQYPEHSDVSYEAAARMGAGIVECDVTFTSDGQLVCRHSECDLHTTTNIVNTPLNAKCTVPWTGPGQSPAPQCCTSDLTLAEFKSLTAKMDAANPSATTAAAYLGGTAAWRTDLNVARAKVLTFRESIALNEQLGVKHTPELKGATHQDRVDAIFGSQEAYAQALIDELEAARVDPQDVWAQSFNVNDVLYWVRHAPRFGRQAVYLDGIDPTVSPAIVGQTPAQLRELKRQGVRIIAPPMWALLSVNSANEIVPSSYAQDIKLAGLDIIAWTFERSDLRQGAARAGWYYLFDPTGAAVKSDSDMYLALDVLAKDVRILGIFSDWPATVTYYANCMGL